MPSYQYSNPHDKDKTVSCPSYLYHENHHTWKDSLYIETGPWIKLIQSVQVLCILTQLIPSQADLEIFQTHEISIRPFDALAFCTVRSSPYIILMS